MTLSFDQDDTLDRHLADCEQSIGYRFADKSLLRDALTHASGVADRLESNERLEFLGDAILGAIVCELLFRRFPGYLEGELTRLKSVLVSRQTCAKVSASIGLGRFLILGKGIPSNQLPSSLLADVFESLVAAVYLDGGGEAAHQFVERFLGAEIEVAATDVLGGDYKSQLQQITQREFGATPNYQVVDEKGPDHCKWFKVAALVRTRIFPAAWGRSKKEAEQRAARNALAELDAQPPPFPPNH